LKEITFVPKKFSKIALEFDEVIPDEIFNWNKSDIEKFKVPVGNSRFPISNYFDVKVEGAAEGPEEVKMVFEGDMGRLKYIGCGMSAGQITVNGDVDLQAGAEMKGGSLTINGNAESYAGREMKGGALTINGNVREYCGATYIGDWRGVSGGVITINGNAGKQLGECLSGGEIYANGNVDILCGIHMTKGFIQIEGDVTQWPGGQMKNGDILIKGKLGSLLEGFEFEGIYTDPEVDGKEFTGNYIKYIGDIGVDGKGRLWLNAEKNRDLL
jgi:formylmethanofuran dehydrogenase subunit C